ncbi:hypothetical protein BOTBODRAFT_27420 [Botryobasidium botryosum FD-172 SS1]|uniref:RRM domain-containing protein n=1 Tax=Botryobasidium botryosum (strain FD-172 SS1) TaxID=930990 RepID=A0A067MZ76_BOTB1|nr:hypothetical protein BOTBODRAFT_27420 [Botryobasidium botryosum FD-172 SS1]
MSMDIDRPLSERISGAPSKRGGRGTLNDNKRTRNSPYSRPLFSDRNSNGGNPDDVWRHDMFAAHNNIVGGSLAARLGTEARPGANSDRRPTRGGRSVSAPIVDTSVIRGIVGGKAGRGAGAGPSGGPISIKGASAGPVTVEVRELAPGTTTADVELIFSQHGKVISTTMPDDQPAGSVVVHVKFEERSDALSSCKAFDGQEADGHILRVAILPAEKTVVDRFGAKRTMDVDVLPDDQRGGSKMYSDSLVESDPRAQVLTRPPQAGGNFRRGRGRGRGRGAW